MNFQIRFEMPRLYFIDTHLCIAMAGDTLCAGDHIFRIPIASKPFLLLRLFFFIQMN